MAYVCYCTVCLLKNHQISKMQDVIMQECRKFSALTARIYFRGKCTNRVLKSCFLIQSQLHLHSCDTIALCMTISIAKS